MKIPNLLWLVLAGGLLTWVAVRSPQPDFEPLSAETSPTEIPTRLSGTPAAGHVVRVFDVDGMCCNGCAGKLATRLDELGAVDETAVDVKAGVVSVIVEEGVPVGDLLALLNVDKYSATARP